MSNFDVILQQLNEGNHKYKVGDFVDLKDTLRDTGKGRFDGKNYAVYQVVELSGNDGYTLASINPSSNKVVKGYIVIGRDIYRKIDPKEIPTEILSKFKG